MLGAVSRISIIGTTIQLSPLSIVFNIKKQVGGSMNGLILGNGRLQRDDWRNDGPASLVKSKGRLPVTIPR